jgi:hypothetical protein
VRILEKEAGMKNIIKCMVLIMTCLISSQFYGQEAPQYKSSILQSNNRPAYNPYATRKQSSPIATQYELFTQQEVSSPTTQTSYKMTSPKSSEEQQIPSNNMPRSSVINLQAPENPSYFTSAGQLFYDYAGKPVQQAGQYVLGGAYNTVANIGSSVYHVGANIGSYAKKGALNVKEHWSPSDRLLLEAVITLPILEYVIQQIDDLKSTVITDKINLAKQLGNFIRTNATRDFTTNALIYPSTSLAPNQNISSDPRMENMIEYLKGEGYGYSADNNSRYKTLMQEYTQFPPQKTDFLYILKYANNQFILMSQKQYNDTTVNTDLSKLRNILEQYRKTYAVRLGKEWSAPVRGIATASALAAAWYLKNYLTGK